MIRKNLQLSRKNVSAFLQVKKAKTCFVHSKTKQSSLTANQQEASKKIKYQRVKNFTSVTLGTKLNPGIVGFQLEHLSAILDGHY